MGAWSAITGTVGGIVKNTVKIGVGYAVGNAIGNSVSETDDPSKQGIYGVAGVAASYLLPAAGSKLIDFFKEHRQNVEDPKTKNDHTSVWKTIGKAVLITAGGGFVIDQTGKWWKEQQAANSTVHNPLENEYLQTGFSDTVVSEPTDRTGEELIQDICPDTEDYEEESYVP